VSYVPTGSWMWLARAIVRRRGVRRELCTLIPHPMYHPSSSPTCLVARVSPVKHFIGRPPPPPLPDLIPLCCTSSDIVRRAGLHWSDVRGLEHMLQRFPKCYDRNGQLCILLSSPDSAGRFFYPVPKQGVSRRFCTR